MASPFIFTDGFDVYGPAGVVPVVTTHWTSMTGTTQTIVAGLSSPGYGFRLGVSLNVVKTLAAAYTRIAGSIRFSSTLASQTAFTFNNTSGSTVFTFGVETSGAITLRTGAFNGSIIATAGAILANSTHVLSFDITLGGAGAGLYAVYLDGASLYSGTGNTANSQASTNQLIIGTGGTGGTGVTLDDLILLDPIQPAYNSAILTSNPVIETQFASGDNQTQFVNDGNVIPIAGIASRGIYRIGAATSVPGANQLWLQKITPTVNCTLASISQVVNAANGTAKLKGVLYADSSGAPGALLNTGTEVVGVAGAVPTVLPFAAPSSLASGTSYWIGFICDTALTWQVMDGAATNLLKIKSNTYTSGPPSPAGAGFTTANTYYMWGNATGSVVNSASVNLNPPPGTAASQIHSATVAQEDLYTFDPLVTNPSTIFGMSVKGFVSKSDAGARTVSLNAKSVSSDTTGSAPGQALATTPAWQGSYFDTDPATGLPWTTPGANAAKAGVSVAS